MTVHEKHMLKYYLKKYFDIHIGWSKDDFDSLNIFFIEKHKMTLNEFLYNQKTATRLEHEIAQKENQEIIQKDNLLLLQHKYNKNLYLIIDDFST